MNATELTTDLRELIEDHDNGSDFTWIDTGGVQRDYRGILSSRTDSNAFALGGHFTDFEATMYCCLPDLAFGTPAEGDKIRCKGQWYRVVRSELDDERVGIALFLESAEK